MSIQNPADQASRHAAALRAISDLLIPESDLHVVNRSNLCTLIDLHASAVDEALQALERERLARDGKEDRLALFRAAEQRVADAREGRS
jgi:DNA-binding transcriptional ArsR family regulator